MKRVARAPFHLTGRKVLVLLIAFFGVVFAVDGFFAYLAIATWPGVAQKNAYQTGLRYNSVLEEARHQAALGWTSGIALDPDGELVVMIEDANGKPLDDLDVTVTLARAVSESSDLVLPLGSFEDGGYIGHVPPPLAGLWHASVVAQNANGQRYRMNHEIVVRP